MKRNILYLLTVFALVVLNASRANAQVAINTTGAAAASSAMLDITSTSRGLLIPRMLESERTAISSPATGLLVYQTDNTTGFYYYTGSSWSQIAGGGSGGQWTTNGNDIYYNLGAVGIGITSPNSTSLLDITSTTKGVLLPRLTQTQRDAISSPATGLLIYQTDNTPGFYYYSGSSWTNVGVSAGVSAVSASAPLSSSGGSTPNISITGAVAIANGGTGATAAAAARTNLGAAKSGSNSDITSLNGLTTPLAVARGGTGMAALSTGQLLLGKGTSAVSSAPLYWDDENGYFGINQAAPTHLLELAGGAYCDGTGDWIAASDKNYKKDILPLTKYGLNSILNIQPVTYIHKSDVKNRVQIGFVAQDLKLIIPEIVEGKEGKMGVAYSRLVPVLVNAIKEQQELIKQQEMKIKSLEERLGAIEAKLK